VLRGAYLQRAQLQHANLSRSQLQGAVLDDAELQGADLSDAQLQGARLKGARLLSMEVFDAPAKPTSQWFNIAVFDRTAIERAQIVDFVVDSSRASALGTEEGFGQARELYMLLKNNFESIGRYEDAAWAYIEEKRMERLKLGCLVNLRHPWRTRRPLAAWLLRWTYELTTGYGERPGRMLFWSLVTILLFALMFAFVVPIGEVAPGAAGHPTRVEGWRNMLNALTHSVSTFATIGFNTLEPLGIGARLLTAMEAALGIGCFALLIFILGNRIRRS
jgi:Pentapeptide repeats (8 copies)/Ion channel